MTTHKEREGGASHTLLTVRCLPYQQLRCYQISHYSAALLMPFDRRVLISFIAVVLMTQTHKRLQKLKR